MALWERVRTELEEAGRIAQGAIDEGRLRLEALRVRKRADRAAQQLGWAVYRAKVSQAEPDAELVTRLSDEIAKYEAEARRLEEQIPKSARTGDQGESGASATE